MGGSKCIVDVNVSQFGQAGRGMPLPFPGSASEFGTVFEFYLAFLFDMEAQVLQQNHIAGLGLGAGGLNFRANASMRNCTGRPSNF